MPIYDSLLEVQGIAAKNEELRTRAEENKARAGLLTEQTQLIGEDAALQKATRDAAQKAQAAQDAVDPSISVDSTQATSPSADPIQKAIADDMATIKTQRELANQIRRTGGDLKAAEKADQTAASAQQTLFHNLNLQFDKQRDTMKQVAAAAGGLAPDGSNVGQVQQSLDTIKPGWMKGANVDTDVLGNLAPGKRTQAYMATMATQGVSAEKQLEARQKELQRQATEAAATQRAAQAERTAAQRDQEIEIKRAGLVDRKQARIDAAEAKRDKAEKPVKPATPTKSEVDSTAALFQQDPAIKLSPEQAHAAAWDYHRKVNDLVAKGTDRAEAEQEARADIEGKITKTTVEKGGLFGYGTTKEEKSAYDKWKKDPEPNDFAKQFEPQMAALATLGVGSKAEDGKLTLSVMPGKTPPAKAALIAQAQAAIDAGKDKNAVLARLKELMVK